MSYTFTTSADDQISAHADHTWEEWHAYVSSNVPEHIGNAASGICCHTCRVIIVDSFAGGLAAELAAAEALEDAMMRVAPVTRGC